MKTCRAMQLLFPVWYSPFLGCGKKYSTLHNGKWHWLRLGPLELRLWVLDREEWDDDGNIITGDNHGPTTSN